MSKSLQHTLLIVSLFILAAQPVNALSIIVNENGAMSLHEGKVLGEDSDSQDEVESENESEDSNEDTSDNKAEEQAREQAKKQAENTREAEKRAAEKRLEQSRVLKTVPAGQTKQLKINNTQRKTEVLIENKLKALKTGKTNLETINNQDQIETDSLTIELPARQEPTFETGLDSDDTNGEAENEQIKKIKKERQERQDKIEIKSQLNDDGTREIEIESATVKAKLKSSQFVVDPATNSVTITTPSGQTHTLIHLPDQALQQMTEAGLITSGDPATTQSELTVETKEDGTVVYKTTVRKQARLLGLIPYEFEDEIELNDADSQIITKPVDTSFIDSILRRLSL